jgi:GH15 family glucan-1,4-alpha-glucosidase
MTKVKVNSGNCGFSVLISAEKVKGKTVTIYLDSECEMVMNMLKDISSLDMKQLFTNHMNNPVYRSAAMHLKHTACPVPGAILKAAEVELGLCLAEDVNISFIKK